MVTKMIASEIRFSLDGCSSACRSPYAAQYKTPGTKNSQAFRRNEHLQSIKKRRHSTMDEKRTIDDIFKEELDENSVEVEAMDTTVIKNKRKKKFGNKLMLSEWMLEKPDDLEQKWIVKVCPKGVRNLVVANRGKTKCFNKTGYYISEFQSHLPGGSSSCMPQKFTLLDCVFSEELKTFYVLDVLAWNSYSVINSATEFRFFFLESKLQENPGLNLISKGNKYLFSNVQYKPADICTLEQIFSEFDRAVDGVLFYHSEVSYLSQVTPLVSWLKVFMLPEVLSIPVNSHYLMEKPSWYSTFMLYIENYENNKFKKPKKKNKNLCDIEMADVNSEYVECEDVMED